MPHFVSSFDNAPDDADIVLHNTLPQPQAAHQDEPTDPSMHAIDQTLDALLIQDGIADMQLSYTPHLYGNGLHSKTFIDLDAEESDSYISIPTDPPDVG